MQWAVCSGGRQTGYGGETAEPQNSEPQNFEGKSVRTGLNLRYSIFVIRHSAVAQGHRHAGDTRHVHTGVHTLDPDAAAVQAPPSQNGRPRPIIAARKTSSRPARCLPAPVDGARLANEWPAGRLSNPIALSPRPQRGSVQQHFIPCAAYSFLPSFLQRRCAVVSRRKG